MDESRHAAAVAEPRSERTMQSKEGPALDPAFLAAMRCELQAPVAAIEAIAAGILRDGQDRPEDLLLGARRIQEGCSRLMAAIPARVGDELLRDDGRTPKERLSKVYHDLVNLMTPLGEVHLMLPLNEALCFGAFTDELKQVLDYSAALLDRLNELKAGRRPAEAKTAPAGSERPVLAREEWEQAEVRVAEPGVVLVADDNSETRAQLARFLENAGHTVYQAESGEAVLRLLDEREFDLVLLDVHMGEIDGYQVLCEMKKDTYWREFSVVMVSAVDDVNCIANCIAKGADDYLPKPLNPKLLHARVNSCLSQSRLRKQETALREAIVKERKRADDLLYQLFPHSVVQELKSSATVAPRRYNDVAVMFTDIVGFTSFSDARDPAEVVARLQDLFGKYEEVAAAHGLEKIKTVGDCFMATGGLLSHLENRVLSCVLCAIDMVHCVRQTKDWDVRVGIHCGPVVAGLVGKTQYCFDVWGDTVNTASRMQTAANPGSIVLSSEAWQQIADLAQGEAFAVDIKGKGPTEVYRFRRFRRPITGAE